MPPEFKSYLFYGGFHAQDNTGGVGMSSKKRLSAQRCGYVMCGVVLCLFPVPADIPPPPENAWQQAAGETRGSKTAEFGLCEGGR